MNGAMYAAMEIIVFILGATVIGFLMGRALSRPPRPGTPEEAPFLRARIDSLETKYLQLLEERDGHVLQLALQDAEMRDLMAQTESAGIEVQAEAEPAVESIALQAADSELEMEALRAELALVNAEIERLSLEAERAEELEARVAQRDAEIGRLETALRSDRDQRVDIDVASAVPGDHALTGGSGAVTDALIAVVD